MNEAQLYDRTRHEPLRALAWDESRVQSAIERIVLETESRYTDRYWPLHPRDRRSDDDTGRVEMSLYDGACGVIWGLNSIDSWSVTVTQSAIPRNARTRPS